MQHLVNQKSRIVGHLPGPKPNFPDGNFLDIYFNHPNVVNGILSVASDYNYPPVIFILNLNYFVNFILFNCNLF